MAERRTPGFRKASGVMGPFGERQGGDDAVFGLRTSLAWGRGVGEER